MLARRLVGKFYKGLLIAQMIAGGTVVLFGGVEKADSAKLATTSPLVFALATELKKLDWWVAPLAVLVTGVLGLARGFLGPPWLWNVVHNYLDMFRGDAFITGAEDLYHHHRVTLFRHRPFCFTLRRWPWNGWLVPVERSGFTTHTKISTFKAPDDADNAEGVAGLAWARNGEVSVTGLPDLTASPTDADFAVYSRNTNLSVNLLRRKVPKARSFHAFPVEVSGNPWGVLVLDSRNPDGIVANVSALYRPLGKFLPPLLERV